MFHSLFQACGVLSVFRFLVSPRHAASLWSTVCLLPLGKHHGSRCKLPLTPFCEWPFSPSLPLCLRMRHPSAVLLRLSPLFLNPCSLGPRPPSCFIPYFSVMTSSVACNVIHFSFLKIIVVFLLQICVYLFVSSEISQRYHPTLLPDLLWLSFLWDPYGTSSVLWKHNLHRTWQQPQCLPWQPFLYLELWGSGHGPTPTSFMSKSQK